MANLYFFSGPCGCGKTTLSEAFAKKLVNEGGKNQVYIIHGDSFHNGFIEPDDRDNFFPEGVATDIVRWENILEFNWGCILHVADKALRLGLDVIIDYVVETELDKIIELALRNNADLFYVVLTASEDCIRERIIKRGDIDMIARALFLKKELESLPENQGHIFDNSYKSIEDELETLDISKYRIEL